MEFIDVFNFEGYNVLMGGLVVLLFMAPHLLMCTCLEICGYNKTETDRLLNQFGKTSYLIGIVLWILIFYLIYWGTYILSSVLHGG